MQNAHGDVVNLTDTDGAVTKTYHYDAFGVEQNIADSDENAFRYCGEYFDTETGTIYLRARYYNPATGRFTQRDSYSGEGSDPLSLNNYTYCHNNPVIYVDQNGHFAILASMAIGAAIGAISSIAIQAITTGEVNWGAVGVSALCGAVGGLAGGIVAGACASAVTAGASSALTASAATSTLSYSVATGVASGAAGSYMATATHQACYGYYDADELRDSTLAGATFGGMSSTFFWGVLNAERFITTSALSDEILVSSKSCKISGYSSHGYNPLPGERTLEGFVKNNVSPDRELCLRTNSAGFNNHDGQVGGVFKRFGVESHANISPHVHQPKVNFSPNGNVYGTVGNKTHDGGVTSPTPRDVKQLYSYLYEGKYH